MPIPAALFNRRRGRESGTSARYSVSRAGGGTPRLQRGSLAAGSSVMARTRSGSGAGRRILLRRRSLSSSREDRISALTDDLLLLILRRLDTRTALGTGVLSRRWAHLPRELPALDLRVGDALPPRYHRWVSLYHDIYRQGAAYYRRHAVGHALLPNIWRYERRAMRAFTSSVESLLEGPRRKVNGLRLEFFFITGNADGMNRLIAEAIGSWGVEDLEAVAKPPFSQRNGFRFHCFPSHGLCIEPSASRLRSLKLRGCTLPPLHEYRALSVLVLQDIPKSTPKAAYERIFTSCLQLRTLHLISCGCSSNELVADAPNSEIRELVVENCTFGCLCLRALPLLERVASGGVLFESDSFPYLKQRNIALCLGVEGLGRNHEVELDTFLLWTPGISSLINRFTGPYRWIVPSSSSSAFLLNLRRLLVADVPSSWDVTWTCLLLDVAPCLETLHVHIAPCKLELGEEMHWLPTKLLHHHLNEFMVAGFKGTTRQIYLVKFVLGACTMLRHVSMFKNGYARDKGRWDWEMATQQQLWTDEEKENTLKQIMDGVPSSTARVQLVLG